MPKQLIPVRRKNFPHWEGVLVSIDSTEIKEYPIEIEWIKGTTGREAMNVTEFLQDIELSDKKQPTIQRRITTNGND